MLYLDFETRSQTDLVFHGLARYARCPTTEVLCMSYAFDEGDVATWWAGEEFPQRVRFHFLKNGAVCAHNAEFELAILEYVLVKYPVSRESWHCSMAQALANGYPAALGALAEALGLEHKKQSQGTRLINEYSKPGFLTEFKPGDRELMQEYCEGDVLAMREAVGYLRPLTDDEWAEWRLNCTINARGLPVDVKLCEAALGYTWELAADASKEIAHLTGGKMTKHTQRKARDAWLLPKLTSHQRGLLTVYKKGEKKMSLDQDHRGYLLECEDLNLDARALLEFINNAGSSALAKYAVAAHHHVNGRVHNTFQWHRAQTGRFGGKGLQPHNFRRDAYSEAEAAPLIEDILGGYELDHPSNTMAQLLRSMITHPDGIYYVDWSAIEGRVAPWLANSAAGERKLDLYRAGRDVYVVTAAEMFGRSEESIDAPLRQSGKIAELSLQFGGSHNALIGMARNYGVTFEEQEARAIVAGWRTTNPWAETIWAEYDTAIAAAVRAPDQPFSVGRVVFQSDGESFLWCRLPCGHLLAYPRPRWELYETPWGEERIGPTFQTSNKPPAGEPPLRKHARGALLFQNSVQAVAAQILRRALKEAELEELNIIGHVHDEIIGIGDAEDADILNEIMLESADWAEGLPVATGGVKRGVRYGK